MDAYRRDHGYLGADHAHNERRTWIVAGICTAMLLVQVTGGLLFKSVALTAAGLHMAAHVAALLVAAAAYALARRYAGDRRFAFGAGKVGYLAGFANAVVMGVVAVLIAAESVQRFIAPETVDYASALPLAVAGLALILLCVLVLRPGRSTEDLDKDGDLNISAARLHLSADVLVSLLTIAGLAAGRRFGWAWADPLAGLGGAALVAQFATSLLVRTSKALLDMNPAPELAAEVRRRLEAEGERVLDLHLWRLGPGHFAVVAVVVADAGARSEALHARLRDLAGLSHVTLELRGGAEARAPSVRRRPDAALRPSP